MFFVRPDLILADLLPFRPGLDQGRLFLSTPTMYEFTCRCSATGKRMRAFITVQRNRLFHDHYNRKDDIRSSFFVAFPGSLTIPTLLPTYPDFWLRSAEHNILKYNRLRKFYSCAHSSIHRYISTSRHP